MRKFFMTVAVLLAGAATFAATPAKADVGCECVKLGQPSACVPEPFTCTLGRGGLCLAPCIYEPHKAVRKHHRHHKHTARKRK